MAFFALLIFILLKLFTFLANKDEEKEKEKVEEKVLTVESCFLLKLDFLKILDS